MRAIVSLLIAGCSGTDGPLCKDGYGMDSEGRCVPLSDSTPGDDTGIAGPNTPPTAPGLSVRPATPRASGSPLACIVSSPSVDIDGDEVTYDFRWSSDDGASVDGSTVDGSALTEGATWTCSAVPTDAIDDGPAGTVAVTIGPVPSPWGDGERTLADSDYLFTGEFAGDGAGAPISRAGDVDGDGRDDLLVGAYWNDETGNAAGKAYLIFGGSLGASREVSLADADWHFIGEQGGGEAPCGDNPSGEEEFLEGDLCDGDWAGHSLNAAGDVDGDGLDDLLISVYRSDDIDIEAGKVALIPGHSLASTGGRMSMADAPIQFMGEAAFNYLGHGVAAGDMDGDGLNDVMLGSYGADDFAGRAYVVLGRGITSEMTLGIGDADYIFTGEAPDDEAGIINSSAGDIDGDGLDDLVVAAMYNKEVGSGLAPTERSGSGKVYIITAAELPGTGAIIALSDAERAWLAEGDGDALACATSPIGDVDGDGLDDIIMGAFGNDGGGSNSGKAYVATAADMRTPGTWAADEASYGFTGEGPEEWAGFSSGPAGDVDLDGRADIMVGAFRYAKPSEMKVDAGKAYLFRMGLLGGTGTYSLGDAHASWVGEYEGDEAGYKATSPGDMNGDGLSDIIVSGWQLNIPSGAGKVWVLLNP